MAEGYLFGLRFSDSMTGNLQAIGFLFTWLLGWSMGGSLLEAGLIQAAV